MKKKFLSIIVVLLFSFVLPAPVQAADYGVVYDETNRLETDKLIQLGTETLPECTEELGIDLRVDVLPESSRSYVFDTARLMTEEKVEKLEDMAKELMTKHDSGVYIVTVDDFQDYSDEDVFHAALNIYNANDFGVGVEKNGLLLLLSMEDRDYNLMTNGEFGNYAFNDAGREAMTEFFLDDFGENEWYDGFEEYLTWADRYLEKAEEGNPYSDENEPWDPLARNLGIFIALLILVLVPLILACIIQSILVKKMKSVEKGTEASAYISQHLKLTKEDDTYTHTTKSKRYNPPKETSSGGGGVTHQHSGSASGTSGKF